tara:strand:- start:67 stop:2454 length:2388 start_codon:yes stop_codon:yes gene_type:complete
MDSRRIAGIGHNQGPPMGGLSTLPIAEKAIGGAVIKNIKTGLKSLNTMFESVGSGLKKSGFKKDERKEAATAIQNEIDKVSKENNRKYRPKILRMAKEEGPSQRREMVVAAVDEENGKIAAIMDGSFSKRKDKNKKIENRKGIERDNPNYNKDINSLYVGGFFPIHHPHNGEVKRTLEALNVPIYGADEGIVTPEQLAALNKRRDEGAMGHREGKLEMGPMGVYGFSKSLRRGLPIQEARADRVSGGKSYDDTEFEIKNAPIYEGVTPIEDLPDIDLSSDLLEEMGDEGLRSLTPETLRRVTQKIVPSIRDVDYIAGGRVNPKLKGSHLPPNVKRFEELRKRIALSDPDSGIKDPYAERVLRERKEIQDAQKIDRDLTIGEMYPKETMIEKLQYGLLNRLSGNLSGKRGLLSLIKRGDDEMIVGSRSPTDEAQVMITAEGERLVPRKQLFDPRVRKERVRDVPLGDIPDSVAQRRADRFEEQPESPQWYEDEEEIDVIREHISNQRDTRRREDPLTGAISRMDTSRNITPETQENARRFQEYRDRRGGDPDAPSNTRQVWITQQDGNYVRSRLTNMDQVVDAYHEGMLPESEVWEHIRAFSQADIISADEASNESRLFREFLDSPANQEDAIAVPAGMRAWEPRDPNSILFSAPNRLAELDRLDLPFERSDKYALLSRTDRDLQSDIYTELAELSDTSAATEVSNRIYQEANKIRRDLHREITGTNVRPASNIDRLDAEDLLSNSPHELKVWVHNLSQARSPNMDRIRKVTEALIELDPEFDPYTISNQYAEIIG